MNYRSRAQQNEFQTETNSPILKKRKTKFDDTRNSTETPGDKLQGVRSDQFSPAALYYNGEIDPTIENPMTPIQVNSHPLDIKNLNIDFDNSQMPGSPIVLVENLLASAEKNKMLERSLNRNLMVLRN